jgi:phytoene synthase
MPVSPAMLDTLPQAQRLALAYAQGEGRQRLLAFLALDARLAGIVRNSHEPMLAQLRLAWWREQLSGDPATPARGEPLLELLKCWQDDRNVLAGLTDGWEGLTGEAPLPLAAFEYLAEARGRSLAALAGGGTWADVAMRMGRNWALADLGARLSHPEEREAVRALALRQDWTQARLPRALRPLAMLHALAARNLVAGENAHALSAGSVLAMIRIGLLGR